MSTIDPTYTPHVRRSALTNRYATGRDDVLAKHVRTEAFGYDACQECSTPNQGRGDSVLVEWPCPTVAAITKASEATR